VTVTRFELEAARLVKSHRWAALATLGVDAPNTSMVAYASTRDLSKLLMYLSGLSEHTRNLRADSRASLVVAEPDSDDVGDPQTLARVSLKCRAHLVERSADEFADLWQLYLERLPDAAPRLALGDFALFKFAVEEARYVGGFAQARTIPISRLAEAALAF
jgi:putative heme iron utilization protein